MTELHDTTNGPEAASGSTRDRLAALRHVVLDMDGTIYLGRTLFPATRPFLTLLRELGIGFSFVTNNSSRSRSEYGRHLSDLGIEVAADAIVTSAQATIHYLQENVPAARRLLVLTTASALDDWRLAGFEIVDDDPDAVVVSFDVELTYERLCRTAYWISRGVPYVATHPDRVCPTDQPTVLPDCGAVCALLEASTGRRPEAIPGKPSPAMLSEIMHRHGLPAEAVGMVGDRLYTDVRMARDAGALAVLALTGEATAAEARDCPEPQRPDLIVRDLEELGDLLRAARPG